MPLKHLGLFPDQTFHNFGTSKSGDGQAELYVTPERRSTDFEALNLGNVWSSYTTLLFCSGSATVSNAIFVYVCIIQRRCEVSKTMLKSNS